MFSRLEEFFEGDDGRLSMTRLLTFMSFLPASVVVIKDSDEGTLGWYLGAYVLGYVGGKFADKVGQMKNSSPVTINQVGGGDTNVVKQSTDPIA